MVPCLRFRLAVLCFALAFVAPTMGAAQAVSAGDSRPYSRANTFSIFGEYSNDSSHIILGATPNRKLAGLGVQYERRLVENGFLRWAYEAEFRPFIVSSDPAESQNEVLCINGTCNGAVNGTAVVFTCVPGMRTFNFPGSGTVPPESGTVTSTCSRQQTLAQGGSPIGFRINLLPRRPLQLTFSSNGGYMFATKPIPLPDAGSFNFTFNFGGGLEYFYRAHRSVRMEYLVQHYSNHFTATVNPGVDSGFVRLSYAFGR
jgi:hypothetical protein